MTSAGFWRMGDTGRLPGGWSRSATTWRAEAGRAGAVVRSSSRTPPQAVRASTATRAAIRRTAAAADGSVLIARSAAAAAAGSAPQRRCGIGREGRIVRDDGQPLLERLRDQNAVERVAMMRGKSQQPKGVGDRYRELLEARGASSRGHRLEIGADLAERCLDCDLPGAGRTDVHGVPRVA